jgi:hypothetical protein
MCGAIKSIAIMAAVELRSHPYHRGLCPWLLRRFAVTICVATDKISGGREFFLFGCCGKRSLMTFVRRSALSKHHFSLDIIFH